MKKALSFLMMLIYLCFVTGQVWNCCEADNLAFTTGKEVVVSINKEASGSTQEDSFAKNFCLKKASSHLSAAKIKLGRSGYTGDDSFKGFVFAPAFQISSNQFNTILNYPQATPLFIRNRVLLI